MLERFDVEKHGYIQNNRSYYFLWNGTEEYASADYGDIRDAKYAMLDGCVYHHNALRMPYDFGGWVPVRETRVIPYKGKFGEGYVEVTNYSTNWVNVFYWIKKGE